MGKGKKRTASAAGASGGVREPSTQRARADTSGVELPAPPPPSELLDQVFACVGADGSRLEFVHEHEPERLTGALQEQLSALVDQRDAERAAASARGASVRRLGVDQARMQARAARSTVKYKVVPHQWEPPPEKVSVEKHAHDLSVSHSFLVHHCVNWVTVVFRTRKTRDAYTFELRVRLMLNHEGECVGGCTMVYHLHESFVSAMSQGPLHKVEGARGSSTWLEAVPFCPKGLNIKMPKFKKVMRMPLAHSTESTLAKDADDLQVLRRALRLHLPLHEERGPAWKSGGVTFTGGFRAALFTHTCTCHDQVPTRLRFLQLAQYTDKAWHQDNKDGKMEQHFIDAEDREE